MGRKLHTSNTYEMDHSYENTRLPADPDTHPLVPSPLGGNQRPSEKPPVHPRIEAIISRTRLGLRVLSFALSLSIAATLGHAVVTYRATQDKETSTRQRVWQGNIKTAPAYSLLGIAGAATLLSAVLIAASFMKTVRRVTSIGNMATAIVSGIGIVLWIGVGSYFKADEVDVLLHLDLVSYACSHRNDAAIAPVVGNMGTLCGEMRYASWAALGVGMVEAIALGTVGWGIWLVKKKGAYAKV